LVKIASYGFLSIVGYMLFIFYLFFSNIFTKRFKENSSDITWFSTDIGTLAGTAALAFTMHVNSAPVLKTGKD